MLNLQVYKILSSPNRVKNNAVRFFLYLITVYDLTGGYKALSLPAIMEDLPEIKPYQVKYYLSHLIACGLLEAGPLTKTWSRNTYRVNPSMLLTADQLRDFFRDAKARQERESLMPKAGVQSV